MGGVKKRVFSKARPVENDIILTTLALYYFFARKPETKVGLDKRSGPTEAIPVLEPSREARTKGEAYGIGRSLREC